MFWPPNAQFTVRENPPGDAEPNIAVVLRDVEWLDKREIDAELFQPCHLFASIQNTFGACKID